MDWVRIRLSGRICGPTGGITKHNKVTCGVKTVIIATYIAIHLLMARATKELMTVVIKVTQVTTVGTRNRGSSTTSAWIYRRRSMTCWTKCAMSAQLQRSTSRSSRTSSGMWVLNSVEHATNVKVHTHTYIYTHIHIHKHIHIHSIHTYMLICIFISIHTCSFAYFVYAYMNTHLHRSTYI